MNVVFLVAPKLAFHFLWNAIFIPRIKRICIASHLQKRPDANAPGLNL